MVNRHKNWEHEYSFINAALSDSFVLFYYIICMWICQKLTWRILLSLTLHLCGNIGTMEGGTRTPSMRWITPLDAIISLVSRETPFSPNKILPCKRQTEVMGEHIHSQTFQSKHIAMMRCLSRTSLVMLMLMTCLAMVWISGILASWSTVSCKTAR